MKMLRKQKIIRIRNPRLRAMVLNLRKVFMNFFFDQETALEAIWLAEEDYDKRNSLLRELEDFRESFHNSILVCGVCNRTEGDRVYIPRHKCWYCTDCMKKNLITTRRSMRKLS